MSSRFTASIGRRLVRTVPKRSFEKAKKAGAGKDFSYGQMLADDDLPFLKVISAEKVFKNIVDKEWMPPVDLAASALRVEKWLRESGFVRATGAKL